MTAGFQVSLLVFGLLITVMFLLARFWQTEYEKALQERNKWRDKYYKANQEGMDEHYALVQMRHKYFVLQRDNEELKYQLYKYQQKPPAASDTDVLYAVKYAMKHAHPDRGGKSEDFIRFNEMYKKMKH
jgi:hypothetical protein